MDIRAGIVTAIFLAVVGAILSVRGGLLSIRAARQLTFYRLSRQRLNAGWRMIFLGLFLLVLAVALGVWGETTVYRYFPPTPTPSLTPTVTLIPTITLTPTLTLTPTVTDTPSVTDTPTVTPTPFLPPAIEALFESKVAPRPDAIFSPLQFSTALEFPPKNPATVFRNPIRRMYAIYSYDNMTTGVQWTALWYRDGLLVHYETKPWDGGTGGYGFADWEPRPEEWLPGNYQVVLFVGTDWKVSGRFILEGDAPTAVPTLTPSPTLTPRPTLTLSATPSSIPATPTP